ncbi:5'-nucleotidase [Coprinopsis cinerea okayama7|uniref:5'-nucleotidase n=1 Tax=Coprinopsis cinerea (strain Okayama-7 / 130 / ATCC MYA-4618 / FGSC 9003) TaxID=240176 RepID=A8PFS4_COPC7|nr:5'-nucleotidase [Coprinopsis cinerea okayama7\|eukprot:XP_001841000.1 5'-nucleotidase [Coprinopsis cinerea okayama7\
MRPFGQLSSLLLLLSLHSNLELVGAEPQVGVDRLISRHYYEEPPAPSFLRRAFDAFAERILVKRGSGFANGGDESNAGKDSQGRLKTRTNYELTFYHLNDVHAHLDEFRPSGSACTDPSRECVGGYPRVKALLDKQRPTKRNSLLLNAGDEFQGTLFYTLYKGTAISSILNQLGFDAFVLGNHEFDDGDDLLADFCRNLTFPTIASNIRTTNRDLARQLVPYKVWDKHQLAVIGLTTEATKTISRPGEGTTFEDPIEAAKRTVTFIKRYHRNVKRIVALTHIGYERDIELAKQTTGISLIVGGHSHTLLGDMPNALGPYPTIVDNAAGEEVFVVTSFRWGEYLGYIDVEYDQRGRIVRYEGAPIHLTNTDNSTKAEDPKLKAEVQRWADGFAPFGRTVVGFTELPLDQTTCQFGECTLGDLIGDALAAMSPSNTTSPIGNHTTPPSDTTFAGGIMNAGGIRASIDGPGNVTLQQVLETFPFGNSVVELTFTGRELWRIFEGIVSRQNLDNDQPVTSFVQVSSSIRFSADVSRPVGERLLSLSVANGDVIDGESGENSEKRYVVATIDYLATGGDNFWPAKGSGEFATLDTIDAVFIEYFRSLGRDTEDGIGRVRVELDGRITVSGLPAILP